MVRPDGIDGKGTPYVPESTGPKAPNENKAEAISPKTNPRAKSGNGINNIFEAVDTLAKAVGLSDGAKNLLADLTLKNTFGNVPEGKGKKIDKKA